MGRTFIKIPEVGICNAAGNRNSMVIGFKPKVIAPTDHPVECFVTALIDRVNDSLGWSSREAANSDIDAAIAVLEELKSGIEPKEPRDAE